MPPPGSRPIATSGRPSSTPWRNTWNLVLPRAMYRSMHQANLRAINPANPRETQSRRMQNGHASKPSRLHAPNPAHLRGPARKSLRRVDPAGTVRKVDVPGGRGAHGHSPPAGHPHRRELPYGGPGLRQERSVLGARRVPGTDAAREAALYLELDQGPA